MDPRRGGENASFTNYKVDKLKDIEIMYYINITNYFHFHRPLLLNF